MSEKFVHLHLHTEYSPQDAPVSLKALVSRAKELGYKSLAVSDHGTVSAWVKFSKLCKQNDIRPIFGIEAYFAEDRHLRVGKRNNRHILLLAKNQQGIKNIYRMSELAYTEGYFYDPRVDWELLERHHEGVICTSACVNGLIPETLLGDDYDEHAEFRQKPENYEKAKEHARRFASIFGDDFYMEVQPHGLGIEHHAYGGVARLAADLGIKLVGTNDVHYLRAEDANSQECLMAFNMYKCIKDPTHLRHGSGEFYLKAPDEMVEALEGTGRMAVESTLEIADKCDAELKFGTTQLPSIEIPDGNEDEFQYLTRLAMDGLRRIGKHEEPAYVERMQEELGVIRRLKDKGHDFDRYFLIVRDYVEYARSKGIRVGVGRGSGAGSLVLFCLGITGIDPIPLDLLFERFLTEDRNEMPDIDVDFDSARAEEVLEYIWGKYGADHCGRIVTFNTFHVAAAIKAAFKVFDPGGTYEKQQRDKLSADQAKRDAPKRGSARRRDPGVVRDETAFMANEVTKLLPKDPNNRPSTKCTFSKEDFDERPDELIYVYDDPTFAALRGKYREIFEFAESIEGLIQSRGRHPAGVVISQTPLVDLCPRQRVGKEELATAFDMADCEQIGLVKFDILRTAVLPAVSKAVQLVEDRHGVKVDIDHPPLDDKKTLSLFADAKTTGIFQFESEGMRKLLRKMRPECFEDVIAANALFRPGPKDDVPAYLAGKSAPRLIDYKVPSLKPVLAPTYGIMVYQEQVMQIVKILAGFSGSEADKVRKAMGKKKREVMDEMKEKFIDGCARLKSCSAKIAGDIWTTMEKFAAYAFNKAHAASYAYVAYQCAYLKAHYPLEFMAACLSIEGGRSDYEAVEKFEGSLGGMGISLLPADINLSKADYVISGKKLRKGFGGIKGVGQDAQQAIMAGQPYSSMFDFCQRAGNATKSDVVRALVEIGAFDDMVVPYLREKTGKQTVSKTQIFAEYRDQMGRVQKERRDDAKQEAKEGIGTIFGIGGDGGIGALAKSIDL